MDQAHSTQKINVSVTVLSQMFLYLQSMNVDVDVFLNAIGVNPADVRKPDGYIAVETYLHIQESAAQMTRDACFGLHMGEFAEAGSWSILGYMMMNCRTMREAFEKSARYARIVGNMITARAVVQLNGVKIIFHTAPASPKMSRHCYESVLSSGIRMIRTLTGNPRINPVEVGFIYSQPQDAKEYQRIFNCPVLFNQKENYYILGFDLINMPVKLANPDLLAYFEQYAQRFLAEMEADKETTRQVTQIILSRLDDEGLSINTVARQMAMSVRTLQNRLADEGVSFSDLLAEIRQRLAKRYLQEDYSVEQITYLLGFSEPSTFRKAFKKWLGVTPGEFRQQQAGY